MTAMTLLILQYVVESSLLTLQLERRKWRKDCYTSNSSSNVSKHSLAVVVRVILVVIKNYIARIRNPIDKEPHTEKECLSIKVGVEAFQVYLLDNEFVIQTDYRALQCLQNSKTVIKGSCNGVWHYSHFDSTQRMR